MHIYIYIIHMCIYIYIYTKGNRSRVADNGT